MSQLAIFEMNTFNGIAIDFFFSEVVPNSDNLTDESGLVLRQQFSRIRKSKLNIRIEKFIKFKVLGRIFIAQH